MSRKRFLFLLFALNMIFIFVKIYHNNLLIKLGYEKQRFDTKKSELKKKKNELLVSFYTLKNQSRVKKIAEEKLGLKQLKLSQIKI